MMSRCAYPKCVLEKGHKGQRHQSKMPMGTSNDQRHSGHIDAAMADPDCALCNPLMLSSPGSELGLPGKGSRDDS